MGELVTLPMDANPLARYLAGLQAELSRRTMLTCIVTMQEMVGHALHQVTPEEVVRIRAELGNRYEPSTGNKHLSALRGYLKVANRMGLANPKTMLELAETKNFRGSRLIRGRAIHETEIQAMLEHCPQEDPLGARDGAMIAILRSGLRRQEVVDLDLEHCDLAENGSLKVRGKGDKERMVPLPSGARALILRWLVHRNLQPGPLLCCTFTLPALERLSTTTIDARLKAVWDVACKSSNSKRPSPHDMRRTLATELLDKDANPRAVQLLLGHARLETTLSIYDLRSEKRKRRAMDLIAMKPAKPKP